MKIVKIIFGSLAALWALGILLKFLRNLPFILNSNSPVRGSYAMGALAGMIIFSLISFLLFKSALKSTSAPLER